MFKVQFCTILLASVLNANAFLFGGGDAWDDLKVTWGINPLSSSGFNSLPRSEADAKSQGWVLEKDCSQVKLGFLIRKLIFFLKFQSLKGKRKSLYIQQ